MSIKKDIRSRIGRTLAYEYDPGYLWSQLASLTQYLAGTAHDVCYGFQYTVLSAQVDSAGKP
jgi:hypothetical protein